MQTEAMYGKDRGGYFRTYVDNALVQENRFIGRVPEATELPTYDTAKPLLPAPIWEGHDDALRCYWRSWEIAFGNLRKPEPGSGFIANFIDPAFNGNVFMWDSVFMLMFGIYGNRAFSFQRTLDNFYAKQHQDGFICREINETTGEEQFHRYDPSSTGPNLLAWSEWTYYHLTGDSSRLAEVFPVVAAYHRWMRWFRTWPDGSYYATGWGCGMDNQPRIPQSLQIEFFHGHLAWIDTTLQHVLSARLLIKMGELLGREEDVEDFREEAQRLKQLVNTTMWDEQAGFYVDRLQDGTCSDVLTIGGFWALLAEAAPPERQAKLLDQLNNPATFLRPHRVPTLAASSRGYEPGGNYWRGSIWSPTNYMVLKGLEHTQADELAHEIAQNHLAHVLRVFEETGTLWENYAPEQAARGQLAAPEFVGWTGVSTIAVLLEFIIGLKPSGGEGTLTWDIRLLDRHGVERYPLGSDGIVTLICERRAAPTDKPLVHVQSNVPLTLKLRWAGGTEERQVAASGAAGGMASGAAGGTASGAASGAASGVLYE